MKKSKKKSSSKKSTLPDNIVRLPGLGGPPIGENKNSAPGITPSEMEKMMGSLTRLLEEQDFDSPEEMNAFMEKHLTGTTIDDIIAQTPPTPEGEAQDLVVEAFNAKTEKKALGYLYRALEIAPNHIHALKMIAEIEAQTAPDLIERLFNIASSAEKHFGKEFMKENKGHFWGILETRPYMRLRESIVIELTSEERINEAVDECEAMLKLNPNDNQGIRNLLRALYLEKNNLAGVRRLNKQYDELLFASAAWSSVFERFLSGKLEKAEKLLRTAHKKNKLVFNYMNGGKDIPYRTPDYISIGDKNEAIACAQLYEPVLSEHPKIKPWLKKIKLR